MPQAQPPKDPAVAALARVRASATGSRRRRIPKNPTMTGSGPDARDPRPLGASVDAWATEHGYDADLAVGGLLGRWVEIVGEQVAGHVTVERYDAETRTVLLRAESQEWAVQLRYLIATIQRRIDAEIGPGLVTRIELRGPGTRAKGKWSVRTGRRSPRTAPIENPALFDD